MEVNFVIHDDTISAVATALGDGGIGIIRISGNKAIEIANNIFRGINGKKAEDIKTHQVSYGHIIADGEILDEVILIIMKAPNTYTREDVVEIHCHGGSLTVKHILDLTLRQGARLAEPGEFTKRAFLNGRLDLTQAQAVMDIIRSKTDASLKMALGHLSGQFADKISSFRHELLGMIAHLEASIDFPEDEIEEFAIADVKQKVNNLVAEINDLVATADTGKILREGLETAIIGKPNVGKSSLLNALLKEQRAIVTDIPGTTRDIIEEFINIEGIPLKIIDTAGIRETDDFVEQLGVEKAKTFIDNADLILVLLDSSKALTREDEEILLKIKDKKAIILVNKSDLTEVLDCAYVQTVVQDKKIIKISTIDEVGLNELKQEIVNMVYHGKMPQSEGVFVNNVRQADLLRTVLKNLDEVLLTIESAMPADCIVIDLRTAWEKLGEITGDTVSDDIIDQIFTQFCIGK